jgi:hypothetical protein
MQSTRMVYPPKTDGSRDSSKSPSGRRRDTVMSGFAASRDRKRNDGSNDEPKPGIDGEPKKENVYTHPMPVPGA